MGEYMTTKEAAEVLGLSFETVSRLAKRGVIKAEKRGRDWLLERDSVEAHLARIKGKGPYDPTRGKTD